VARELLVPEQAGFPPGFGSGLLIHSKRAKKGETLMTKVTLSVRQLFIMFILVALATVLPGCSSSPGQSNQGGSAAESGADRAKSESAGEVEQGTGGPEKQQAESSWSSGTTGSAPARQPREATLEAGTPIIVRTASQISTKTNRPGEIFYATLEQPLVEGDWVIAKKGAEIEGVVTECDPGGRVQGVAQLAVQLRKLTLADGRTVEIQTSAIRKQARTTRKKDAQKIGIGAGIGAAVGAIAGGGKGAGIGAAVGGGAGSGVVVATRGDPATIASESKLSFKLADPVRIVEEL
jgi:hypothetical protein